MVQAFDDVDHKLGLLSQRIETVKDGLLCDKVTLRVQQEREEEALLLQLQQLRTRHANEIAQLEAEVLPRIAAYEHEARLLRAARNELAPACRLPPELLCIIFNVLRRSWNLWTRTTHVCRRWRAAALDCGPLWASISTRQSPREVAAFLERSGNAGLHAHLDLWDRKLCALQHINRSMERIQSLDVDVTASFMQGAHSHLFTIPAWGLETMFASTDGRLTHDHRVDFPADMFAGDAPRLRRISLRGCWFPPQWPPLAQLAELSIDGHHPLTLCDAHELTDLLRQTSGLTVLKLGGILHTTGEGVEPPKVSLPNLTLLSVSESVRSFVRIWGLLSLPVSTSLAVSIHRDDFEDYRDAIDAVAAHVRQRAASGESIEGITVFASTWNVMITAEGATSMNTPTNNIDGAAVPVTLPLLRLNVLEEKDGAVVTRLVRDVFAALPLNRVRDARFDIDEIEWRFVTPVTLSSQLWADMLLRTPILERLALRVVLLRDVLAAITSLNAPRRIPLLRQLQLYSLHFAATDRAPESSASDWVASATAEPGTLRSETNGEALRTWLAARCHADPSSSGTPLRVVLSKCRGLTPQLLDDLRQVVHSVEWNVEEQGLVSG
jgi:hypothetical protein